MEKEIHSGIPIRNIWHMLLYAWKRADFIGRQSVAVEQSPTLDALLAKILIDGIRQQIRRGLARSYRSHTRTLRGIRGRIDFERSLTRLRFHNGQADCRFHELTVNEPRNQIIRSTCAMLTQTGEFGPDDADAEGIRHELRHVVRDLDGIDLVPGPLHLLARQSGARNDSGYQIMLNISELLWRSWMPTETMGARKMIGLGREQMILYNVYEKFVANFYLLNPCQFNVSPQSPIYWNAGGESEFLPRMEPDIRFVHRQTGAILILDTKFTEALTIQRYGDRSRFKSDHLYQMYAYLRTQEQLSDNHRCARGILLYPTVHEDIDETLVLQGHPVQIRTINLALGWPEIESRLLSLVESLSKRSQYIFLGGDMSNIAILGWGSLCWDRNPRFDNQHGSWREDGPMLKLEFSRVSASRKGALTLVIDPTCGAPNQIAFAMSRRSSLADAVDDLRMRERTTEASIGLFEPPSGRHRWHDLEAGESIRRWAARRRLDAVIWTDLMSNFADHIGVPFSVTAAINYLEGLTREAKEGAFTYIRSAPPFIRTPLRTSLATFR